MDSISIRSAAIYLGGFLLGQLHSHSALAIDPGYLDAIEADVAEFTSGEFKPPENSTWLGDVNSEEAQLADLEGFSQYLQNKSPGSFIFYKKLPAEYKEQLLKDYLATGDLDRIKDDIFKYARELKR
jgi:hypothetical protein